MAELDNQLDNVNEPTEPIENTPADTPTVSSRYEELARSQGWVPKEEWQGDPEDWTDSREFVKRGELFHKISSQSGEIKELRKLVANLSEHHKKVKETEFQRALDYLKQEKKNALEDGDADKLIAVDEAILKIKEEQKTEEAANRNQAKQGPTPAFVDWVRVNPWYAQDPELRAFADDLGTGIFSRNKGISEEDLYEQVRQRVFKAFPEKFKGAGKAVPTVEGASHTPPGKKDTFRLTEDEERVMKTFVRSGVMTKEEYIAELKRVKGAA